MCFRARPVPDTKVHQILGGFVSWKSRLGGHAGLIGAVSLGEKTRRKRSGIEDLIENASSGPSDLPLVKCTIVRPILATVIWAIYLRRAQDVGHERHHGCVEPGAD